jgi:hypothetical protein
MFSQKDLLVWHAHYRDLLREAERDRMIHQALAAKQQTRLHQRALVWLGTHFVAWGCILQRRYAFGLLKTESANVFESSSMPDCGCT